MGRTYELDFLGGPLAMGGRETPPPSAHMQRELLLLGHLHLHEAFFPSKSHKSSLFARSRHAMVARGMDASRAGFATNPLNRPALQARASPQFSPHA